MNSPKDRYIQMVQELKNAEDYSEYMTIKKKYSSQFSIHKILDPQIQKDSQLTNDHKLEIFAYYQSLPYPSQEDVLNSIEEWDKDRQIVTLLLPNPKEGFASKIYLTKEDGAWKYNSTDKYY